MRVCSLNTTPALYNALKESLIREANVLDDLDRRTIQLFIDDFKQCGVHLDAKDVSSGLRASQHAAFCFSAANLSHCQMKFSKVAPRFVQTLRKLRRPISRRD